MAGQTPEREFKPVRLGGVLDESGTPSRVGGSGLTACQNLVYRRFGSWGKRAGSTIVFAAVTPAPPPTPSAPTNPYQPAPVTPPAAPTPPPGTSPGPKGNPGYYK